MNQPLQASTQWREHIGADEARQHALLASKMQEIQKRIASKQGAGRALHRKQILAAHGQLQIDDQLPEFARQGLAAQPGTYPVTVRFSNGSMKSASNQRPDVRGLGIRIEGLSPMPNALGSGLTQRQDLTLIQASEFAFANSQEFGEFVEAAAAGPLKLIGHVVRQKGWLQGFKYLAQLQSKLKNEFKGFERTPMHSAVPIQWGDYAVKVRLLPQQAGTEQGAEKTQDWGDALAMQLKGQDMKWALQIQPYLDDVRTPIEQPQSAWDSPFTTIGHLLLPAQDQRDSAFAQEVERSTFDPWQAMAVHRPLGEIMRARKAAYFSSQTVRQAK